MSEPTSSGGSTPAERHRRTEALASLARVLESEGWSPRRLPDQDVFAISCAGFACYALLRPEAEQLIGYAVAPLRVPIERRPVVAEFLTRANYGLYHGNFELDYADGEVRAKCSLDFEGERLTPALIRNTLLPAARLLDAYLSGLRRVALEDAEPLAVVQQIEAQP